MDPKDEKLKVYLLNQIDEIKSNVQKNIINCTDTSDVAIRIQTLEIIEKIIKNYNSNGYRVTNGKGLYFKEWDDVYPVIVINDQPAAITEAKIFNDIDSAQVVAKQLGWQVEGSSV